MRKHLFVLGLLAVLALSITVASTNAQSIQSMLTANGGENNQHPMKDHKKHGHDDGALDEDEHGDKDDHKGPDSRHGRGEGALVKEDKDDHDEIQLGIRVHVNLENGKLVLHVAGSKPNTDYTAQLINGTSQTVNLGNFTTNAAGNGVLKTSLPPGDYNGSIKVVEKAIGAVQFEIGNVKFTVPAQKHNEDE